MKLIILLILVFPIFYYALKQKKWYLYLAFSFIGLLPDTFAIEISSSLPLLTAERCIILFLFFIWLGKKDRKYEVHIPKIICIYTFINIIISFINFRYGFAEINKLFILLFENVIFLILIIDFIKNKDELNRCIDYMIAGAVVQCFIALLQVIGLDISSLLNIVVARSESGISSRMGVIRAGGTIGAITLGSYCAILFILTMYRYEMTRRKRYLLVMAMEFATMCCTMSRSSIGPFLLVIVLMFFAHFPRYLNLYGKYIFLSLVLISLIFISVPKIRIVSIEVIKSMINTLGGNLEISSDFGMNVKGLSTRLIQWSSITYMFHQGGFLFGMGYQAYVRGAIYYFFPQYQVWMKAPALDVGIVRMFAETGLIGVISWILLVGCILVKLYKNRKELFCRMSFYIVLLYIVLNIFTAFSSNGTIWLLWSTLFAYEKIMRRENISSPAMLKKIIVVDED